MNSEFLERIKTKRAKLEEVKLALKEKFIGIDDVIDKIIDNISLWYFTPEIQFRPLIISLWGITGVGKTDLVRTLVRLLNFNDKFIEIQMDVKNDYARNVENYLENSGIDCNEPAILLLDEIQRYRTIDEHGEMLDNKYFNDVWMLLSDGKFQNNSQRRAEVIELLMDEMYWLDRRDDDVPEASDEKPKRQSGKNKDAVAKKPKTYRFQTSYWTANRFRKMLNLQIPVEDIMKMNLGERMQIMEDTLKLGNVNDGKSYEKLLIFISGNLDNAFRMADEVEDSERDADIYHELSKRINIINIKAALATQFKPEQIARFGNNHVIYPCLDKKSYYIIIKKNCYQILNRIETEHHMKITLSDNIFDVIYRNGVFPAQGVRPAISTVFNVLGSNLPHFMYHALLNDINKFYLDFENKTLFSEINKKKITKEIVLDIDNIRESKSIDEKMLFAVHELGHALTYALLFNTPPKQININSSGLANGFVINHTSVDNKTFIRNQLVIYLAGLVAEELVFGEDFKSNGVSMDIMFATDAAGKYVRSYGMNGTVSKIERENQQSPYHMNYDIDSTNSIIENILAEEKKRAKDLLNKHLNVYKLLIKFAMDNGTINVEQFLFICNNNGLNLKQKEINDKLIYSYDDKVKHFLKQ
jgi:cell division protease FtsH